MTNEEILKLIDKRLSLLRRREMLLNDSDVFDLADLSARLNETMAWREVVLSKLPYETVKTLEFITGKPMPKYDAGFTLNNDADACGTSLKGHIYATYGELRELFGEPSDSDGYKVSGEWTFTDQENNVFTVYDWKCTSLYDYELPSVEVFRARQAPTQFNVGGKTDAWRFIAWLENCLSGIR